jgi:alpha-soluble NSF attachment protein
MSQDPRALLQKACDTPLPTTYALTLLQADKAASAAGGGFSFFGGRAEKYENAAELYIQAANAFRMQKQGAPSCPSSPPPTAILTLRSSYIGKEAGQAFERAAALQKNQINEPDDAANTLTEAFKVYRKTDPEDAARCLSQAITHYTSKGNFRRAATHQQNLAEVYEVEIGDQKRAVAAYATAAEWFESDNAEALANKLHLKVADLSALLGDYPTAIRAYEHVAKTSTANNLMRWSVKDFLLRAGICHLAAGDTVATNRALEGYREMDPSFLGTREHQLLVDLQEAVEQGEQEAFADKLFQYDQMSKLDKWKTTLLLRVKEAIEEKGEDFS